ncbi:MAG TPA: methyltransferase [Propionicimonas sp.]|uniref:methyltransferase family protein n=1 Tax=Propionicimonas sp. TaxID=1955623 RepID=UPI002F41841E
MALQAVLLVLAVAAGWLGAPWPPPARPWLWGAGGVLLVAGIALLLAGGAGLGKQLTPFPRPVDTGELRQDGVYGLVRHPIYGGALVLLLGWALATSPLALLPLLLAIAFLEAKRRREEAWLEARYPDYPAYRERVRRRFIPYLF